MIDIRWAWAFLDTPTADAERSGEFWATVTRSRLSPPRGEHDEFDIQVVLKIEGGPEPIQVRKTVPSVAAGAAATATLGLPSDPPFGTPVTVSVEIRPVPGEEKKDNNSAEYDAFFSQG